MATGHRAAKHRSPVKQKQCSHCGKVKEIAAFYHKFGKYGHGFKAWCRKCCLHKDGQPDYEVPPIKTFLDAWGEDIDNEERAFNARWKEKFGEDLVEKWREL